MFRSIRLGSAFGIPLYVHWTLPLLAAWFVSQVWIEEGFDQAATIIIIIIGMVASVTAHEFGHVLAARHYGIGTRSITLSPIGGVALLERYPGQPGPMAVVALGGPAVSLALTLAFAAWAAASYVPGKGYVSPVEALFVMNLMLLAFNLLPVWPMDGGKVLEAILKKAFGDAAARKGSSWLGHVGSSSMIVAGLLLPSVSLVLIGLFLLVVVSHEFGNPVTRALGLPARSAEKDAKPVSNGIFVAFDGAGRHFAYARHWLDCPGDMEAQKREVAAYALEAYRRGGELRLLTLLEFREQVLAERAVAPSCRCG